MNTPIMTVHLTGKSSLIRNLYVVEFSECIEYIQRFIIQWELNERTILMTPEQTIALLNLIQSRRSEAGLSINEVGRRAKVDTGTVWRIEQGMIAKPTAKSLMAIGEVLGIRPIDLFSTVGWIPADELPSLGTYLRTKLHDLPEEALRDIQAYVTAIAHKHDVKVEDDQAAVSKPPVRKAKKEN